MRQVTFTKRQLVLGLLASVGLAAGCSHGCNNDNLANHGVITAAPRFQLVVEEDPTPARLLLDSATGDLWQLRTDPAGEAQWARVANGPTDARVLTPQQILGAQSPETPKP